MSCSLYHERAIGDILSKFAIQLTRAGEPADLNNKVVKFTMFDPDGDVIVALPSGVTSNVTVTDPDLAYVEYDFVANDVDEAGDFYGYFKVYDNTGAEPETFPASDDAILIRIFDPAQVRTTPDPNVITAQSIADLARSPRRVRTVEGTVEERSVNELIKAEQYLAAKEAGPVPWGMRVAKTKPPSTLS